MSDFKPEITAFCCRYCSYSAADSAGSMGHSYPASVKIVLVPCTGKIDVQHVLKAFSGGADGVMVAGCHEDSCHFLTGNARAKRRLKRIGALLDEVGVGKDRIAMFNVSYAMGARFAEMATEFTAKIRTLGPSPIRAGRASAQAAPK